MTTFDFAVAIGADDGTWYASTFETATPNVYAGKLSSDAVALFARFTPVLNGTINSAAIHLRAAADQTNTVPLRIRAVKEATPTAPTSIADANSRPLTTAYVDWTPGSWTGGEYYASLDIASILQELLDEGYQYTGTQAILIYVLDNGATTNQYRSVRTYNHNATLSPPRLIGDYTPVVLPTIALDTPNAATLSPNAAVEFTGSDLDGDALRYRVQIADNSGFLGGEQLVFEIPDASGTGIHPQPTGGVTWEGHNQTDDRVASVFQAGGGVLDSIDFLIAVDSGRTATGTYVVRVYETAGLVIALPPIWVASTAYSINTVIRPTSEANADVHMYYRCKTAGTSHSVEPSWPGSGVLWTTVAEGTEVADGTVVWEVVYAAHLPNPVAPADTPTPGWIAQSDVVPYSQVGPEQSYRTATFTASNRIRLVADAYYFAVIDWRPDSTDPDNTITVHNAFKSVVGGVGNVYLDGNSANNNGPRIIDITTMRVYEMFGLLDKASGTDAGFINTETPSDVDPFNAGERIRYTVQAGSELDIGTEYFWRARVTDPDGSGLWSDWTAERLFTVVETEPIFTPRAPLLGGLF